MTQLKGFCDPRFRAAGDLFARNIRSGQETGASLHVTIDGEDVIDLWGGWHDREHSAPWNEHTIVNVFSASKTVASLAVLLLVERGALDLDAPVATYWPEFAQNGKERALVQHILAHTVGLPAWEPPFGIADAYDTASSTARLAAQAPWWEPGARGSYHASSFGHLVSELVLRVSGRRLSQYIADEIAGPLDADFYLGLPDTLFDRVATVYPAPVEAAPSASKSAPQPTADPVTPDPLAAEREIRARTRQGSFSGQKRDPLALFNSPEWRQSELAGSSGHANARGLGRVMTVLANGGSSHGVKLLSDATIARIFEEQFAGIDGYYLKPIRWGIGYALAPLEHKEKGPLPFLRPGPRTCYWYGAGGSLSIADVERGVTLTYAMNQCQAGRGSLNAGYYDAVYDSL
ncbi:serine hydrolase domain-containing protein [Novosphingobium album (ex Liu et al. 2023)]|uniref:Serine hydrolase n=1 Tax=Novosphingobium album (ex Liu et al. 2023) TaxID=3031130 RepID=A0ABT5WT22_9SPHN|nr:serine hydrolase domain-containing protein [Novosphingobium album (ex Liu et al. 2023)]MDE8652422.1 serine hydrolase [Novosphingobium album (ex Liu et al. 2023)]